MSAPETATSDYPHSEGEDSGLEATSTVSSAIQGIVEEFDVQPVLFIGSGLPRRYMGAPDWEGALRHALETIGNNTLPYSYFVQKYADDKVKIGTAIAELMFEWAWNKGKNRFPANLFEATDRHIFMKYIVSEHLIGITPSSIGGLSQANQEELQALSDIRPHAIITTNYDSMIELIF